MVHVFTLQSKERNNMDLYSMIQNGAHFKVEVTSEDLVTFADRLITKSQEIKAMELQNIPMREMADRRGSSQDVPCMRHHFMVLGEVWLSCPCQDGTAASVCLVGHSEDTQ